MKLWRIATETRRYSVMDLSGAGAAKNPGRWNDEGEAVVYCAPSISMAVLETAAHIDGAGFPLNRYLIEIDVAKNVWAARKTRPASGLSVGWDAIPAGGVSVKVGSSWLASKASAILLVPSSIVPEEWVALINPAHRDARSGLSARAVRRFEYNRLLRN